jgi:chromosome segregation ATPase
MSNPVDLRRILNVDDTTPIDVVIQKLTTLKDILSDFVGDAVNKSARYQDALSGIADAAKKLESQISNLDATEKEHQDLIAKSAAQADKMLTESDAYTQGLKEQEKQIIVLNEEIKKLTAAKEKLNTTNLAEKGSLAALKAELKAATDEFTKMGTATSQAVKDEQLRKINELAKGVNTVEKALKTARTGTIAAAGSYNALSQQVAAAKARLKEMEGGIDGNSKEFKELQKYVADGTKKLKAFDSAVGDNTRNVGNYQDALSALPGPLQGVIGGIQGITKAGLAFIATPIGAIIGALAVALGSLMAYFNGSIEGQDNFNRVLRI